MESPEVAIVGGGIGGGALATVLAAQGVSVAVLERDMQPIDCVRGEWMAPWGVTEADALGILDILRTKAGGFYVPWVVGYDETVTPEDAEARKRNLRSMHALGVGSFCAGHPAMCEALADAATLAGATFLRGVTDVVVNTGEPPVLSFQHGKPVSWRPKLIVGADGRTSTVRRQLNFPMSRDEPHHLVCGMLIDGVPEWPHDTWHLGTEGTFTISCFRKPATNLGFMLAMATTKARVSQDQSARRTSWLPST
jgi:2-polyprenyl-6-methoxyphenol hydroxylase-like FAD-dependent oxidoreductase